MLLYVIVESCACNDAATASQKVRTGGFLRCCAWLHVDGSGAMGGSCGGGLAGGVEGGGGEGGGEGGGGDGGGVGGGGFDGGGA